MPADFSIFLLLLFALSPLHPPSARFLSVSVKVMLVRIAEKTLLEQEALLNARSHTCPDPQFSQLLRELT